MEEAHFQVCEQEYRIKKVCGQSFDKHGIPKGVEAVILLNSYLVSIQNQISTGERETIMSSELRGR